MTKEKLSKHCNRWRCRMFGCLCNCNACFKIKSNPQTYKSPAPQEGGKK